MSSKQQMSQQPKYSSKSPSEPTVPLIFSDVSFFDEPKEILQDLRRHNFGIEGVIQLRINVNGEKRKNTILIDFRSDKLAQDFIKNDKIIVNRMKYSIQTSPKSLIVTEVSSNVNEAKLLQDLGHNYLGVEKVSQFCNLFNEKVGIIQIDFKSNNSVKKILEDKHILIDGKRRPVQPYWSLIHIPAQNGTQQPVESVQMPATSQSQIDKSAPTKKSTTLQPQKPETVQYSKYLTKQRVKELFQQQQIQLETMIYEFENKWNARLSSLSTPTDKTAVDQLSSIFKDLTTVCQQFKQQNTSLQQQLASVANRVQNAQTQLSNGHMEEKWPQLSLQNGH